MVQFSSDKQTTTAFEYPPLRSLNDFILNSARFQIPNIKDLDKWGNRVINNLLYYQTNYIFTTVIIFIVVGLIHPGKMFVGALVTFMILLVFTYIFSKEKTVCEFRKQYPIVRILLVLVAAYIVTCTLDSFLVFLIGILLPFSVIFVHASLRLRNLKNKAVNKIEGIGLKQSPMGYLLEQLGYIFMEDAAALAIHSRITNSKNSLAYLKGIMSLNNEEISHLLSNRKSKINIENFS